MIVVRLALPVRSPSPLSVPWTWPAPANTAAIELATAQPVSSWQWMPIVTSRADVGVHGGDDLADLVGQRSAVGVAQHDVAGALDDGGLERPQGELRVGLVAVEEVLHVDEHPTSLAGEVGDRVGDHRLALVERRLQRLRHVVVAALGDDAHRRRAGLDEVAQRGVVVDLAARAAGRAEGHQRARCQAQFGGGAGEELDVLGVGARPPALDVLHAEEVELLGDAQLVLDGGRHPLDLQAVAQGGVEDLDVPAGLGRTGSLMMWLLLSRTGAENARSRPEAASACTRMVPRALRNDDDRVGGARRRDHAAIQPGDGRWRQPGGGSGCRSLWVSLCMNGG